MHRNPLLDHFRAALQTHPDRELVRETTGKSVTVAEVARDTEYIIENLRNAGFKAGDRVLLLSRPNISLVTISFALLELGAVLVIADPGMGKEVFDERISLAEPQWIVGETIVFLLEHHPLLRMYLRRKKIPFPEFSQVRNVKIIFIGPRLPGLLHAVSYEALRKRPRRVKARPTQTFHDTDDAMIIFTSGTTAKPKAVVHTIGSLRQTLKEVQMICQPTDTDILYTSLPHFLFLSVALGVTTLISTRRFSAETFNDDLSRFEPSMLFGPPAEFMALSDLYERTKTQMPVSVKKIYIGSAPVLVGFLTLLLRHVPSNTQVTCIYGMTEIVPVAIVDGREKISWKGTGDLLGTIRESIQHSLTKENELVLSGPHLSNRYLLEKRSRYVTTGDIVKFVDNRLILVGRKKDMIIKGNYNIYPELYESTIQKIPGVRSCAMVGVYNEKTADEEIVLCLEAQKHFPMPSIPNMYRRLQSGRFAIDTHALPDRIILMTLPRIGRQQKIDKAKIREMVQET